MAHSHKIKKLVCHQAWGPMSLLLQILTTDCYFKKVLRKKDRLREKILMQHAASVLVVYCLATSSRKSSLVIYSFSWLYVYGFPFCMCHLHLKNALTVSFVDINTVIEYYSSSSPVRTPTQKQIWQTCQVFSHLFNMSLQIKKYPNEPYTVINDDWAFLVKFLVYLRKKKFQNS